MSKLIIFSDRHHDGLAYSLRLLAKRLNADIYFPIGLTWWQKGFWDVAKPYSDSPDTANQYLSLDQRYHPVDGTLPLNIIKATTPTHYEIEDLAHGDSLKSITFDQFLNLDIDFIIASLPDHYATYTRLRNEYKPNAKVICQMGNHWPIDFGIVKNLMASTIPFDIPSGINAVFYHQEFDLNIFRQELPTNSKNIYSFVHYFPNTGGWKDFSEYKNSMNEFNFKSYGAGCPDGGINGVKRLANKMRESSFVWHDKKGSDGFGHVIHSAMAVGRPLIVNYEEYKNKLAGQKLIPDKTCISLDSGESKETIRQKIKKWSQPDQLTEMGMNIYNKFKECVNYKNEEENIRTFMSNLR